MSRRKSRPRTPGLSAHCSAARHRNAAIHLGAWAALFLVCAIAGLARGAASSSLLLVALATYFANKTRERLRLEASFRLGAQAEQRVGALLADVESWGWAVEHDVLKQGGGNIDHVVHSPRRRSRSIPSGCGGESEISTRPRHAEWAARHYGGHRRIAPVICIQRSNRAAVEVDGVVVVGSTRLLGFLSSTYWPESINNAGSITSRSRLTSEVEDLLDPDAASRMIGLGA